MSLPNHYKNLDCFDNEDCKLISESLSGNKDVDITKPDNFKSLEIESLVKMPKSKNNKSAALKKLAEGKRRLFKMIFVGILFTIVVFMSMNFLKFSGDQGNKVKGSAVVVKDEGNEQRGKEESVVKKEEGKKDGGAGEVGGGEKKGGDDNGEKKSGAVNSNDEKKGEKKEVVVPSPKK